MPAWDLSGSDRHILQSDIRIQELVFHLGLHQKKSFHTISVEIGVELAVTCCHEQADTWESEIFSYLGFPALDGEFAMDLCTKSTGKTFAFSITVTAKMLVLLMAKKVLRAV